MERIKVLVGWSGRNYSAVTDDERLCGSVVCTHKTYSGLMNELASSVEFHIEGIVEHGDAVPEWLVKRQYMWDLQLTVPALLHRCQEFTTLSAISKFSGIPLRQLTLYANDERNPRPEKRQQLLDAINEMGYIMLMMK